jgi:hypothetical protein
LSAEQIEAGHLASSLILPAIIFAVFTKTFAIREGLMPKIDADPPHHDGNPVGSNDWQQTVDHSA